MEVNLTLLCSSKVYLNLIENISIEEIDEMTTKYQNQEEILALPEFEDIINRFYTYTTNYRSKIKNPTEKRGTLYITYFDHNNLIKLRVLYKKDAIKRDSKKVAKAIKTELKQANNSQLVISILNQFNFIFDSEYNQIYYQLNTLKRVLANTTTPPDYLVSKHNLLIKIIYDELVKGYSKNSNTPEAFSYFYIRLVDEFLETKKNILTIPQIDTINLPSNHLQVCDNISSKNQKSEKVLTKKKSRKEDYHGMGDYYLGIEENRWRM